jgi:hypothetical protein
MTALIRNGRRRFLTFCEYHVHATFFVIGKNRGSPWAYPRILREAMNWKPHLSSRPVGGELRAGHGAERYQQLIEWISGRTTILFRPPYVRIPCRRRCRGPTDRPQHRSWLYHRRREHRSGGLGAPGHRHNCSPRERSARHRESHSPARWGRQP